MRGHTGAAWWLSQSSLLEKRRNEKKKRLIRSDPSVDLKHTLHLSPQNHDTVGLVETDVEGVPSCPEPRRKRFIFGAWVIMSPPQL